jgi:hypothetical protein
MEPLLSLDPAVIVAGAVVLFLIVVALAWDEPAEEDPHG